MVGKKRSQCRIPAPGRRTASLAGIACFALSPAALAVQFMAADGPGRDDPAADPVPLRLAQALQVERPRPADRGPDGLVDGPLGLRAARGLAMPGAAGPGRGGGAAAWAEGSPIQGAAGNDGAAEAAPGRAATEDGSQFRENAPAPVVWSIPPIRWDGSSGYSIQRSASSTGASTFAQNIFSNYRASSYIYAPWLATVSGRIGLTTSASGGTSGAGAGALGSQDHRNRSSTLIGGGDLNLFPNSRFPFQAYLDRSDSRASGNLVSNDYVNTRFGLRQIYRAEDGVTSAGAQFDRSVVNASSGTQDAVTALAGNFATDLGIVKNSLSGRYSLGSRNGTGERARLFGINTAHTANLDDNLSLSGNFNYLDNAIRSGSAAGSFGDSRTRFFQLNGFATWMPEFDDREDLPLTLSGSLRYARLHNEFAGQGVESQNWGGNLNALYRWSNNFTAGANGGINQVATVGAPSILLTVLGANLNYVGDPLNFGNFSYNWNVGGNGNWQSGSGAIPANYFLGAQAGHSLGRFVAVSDSQTLSLSLAQTVNVNQNQTVGSSTSLAHSLAASYGLRWGEQFTGNSTLSLSDIVTAGFASQHYRMLGLGFNGMGQLSPLSSASVNLQFNWNQQRSDDQPSFAFAGASRDNQHMTLLGSASYTHARLLGVRGLRYALTFSADTRLRDERLLGNTTGAIDRTRWTVNNRIDYRFGLLDFRVNAALNDVGGKKNALLFFQVTRQFGVY